MAGRSKAKRARAGAAYGDLAAQIVKRWGASGGEVSLDRVISELGDVQRYDIVASLKELERAGRGAFIVGRAGSKARFVWNERAPKLARAPKSTRPKSVARRTDVARKPTASGTTSRQPARREPEPRAARRTPPSAGSEPSSARDKPTRRGAAPRATATLEHVFHLRPGCQVRVALPADVDGAELERFCQFLRTIPFSGDPREA